MNPTTEVIKQEHANGTFDVIFRNNAHSDVTLMTDDDRLVWINLLAAIASGVNNLVIHDSYRDKADFDKGVEFLDMLDADLGFVKLLEEVYNNTNGIRLQKVPFADALAALYRVKETDQFHDFLGLLESVHMSGSIVAKDDTTQLRGLVTITYRKGESSLKVRLSGALEESVGLRLREPYQRALEQGKVQVLAAPVKEQPAKNGQNGPSGVQPSTGQGKERTKTEKEPNQSGNGKDNAASAKGRMNLSDAQLDELSVALKAIDVGTTTVRRILASAGYKGHNPRVPKKPAPQGNRQAPKRGQQQAASN